MSAASPSCRRVTQLLLCGITEISEHTEPRRNQSNTLLWAVFFRHTWLPYSQITGLRKTCQRIWRWIRTERLILQTAELNSGFNVSPEISKVGLKDVTPYWLPPVFNFSFSSALQQIDMNNSIITTSPGLQPSADTEDLICVLRVTSPGLSFFSFSTTSSELWENIRLLIMV